MSSMAKPAIKRRPQKLNLAVQLGWLEKLWPGHGEIQKGLLIWNEQLRPSYSSNCYTIRLTYKISQRPKVIVVDPLLECPEGKSLPHVFPGNELCLYYEGDWDASIPIAKTIIPWASEWLLHYEIWLFTGVWTGGGIHPRVKERLRKFSPA